MFSDCTIRYTDYDVLRLNVAVFIRGGANTLNISITIRDKEPCHCQHWPIASTESGTYEDIGAINLAEGRAVYKEQKDISLVKARETLTWPPLCRSGLGTHSIEVMKLKRTQ